MLGVLLMMADLAIGPFVPDPPLLRFVITLGGVLAFFRVLDLAFDPVSRSVATRIALVWLIPDVRTAVREPPSLDLRALVRFLAFGAVTAAALACVLLSSAWQQDGLRLAARWSAGLVAVYCSADGAVSLMVLVGRALGWRFPPMHRDPILSRTVSELWSQRWNRVVHDWLERRIFKPLLRRGASAWLAASAAFLVSATLHAWLAGVAVGAWAGAAMGAFFIVQVLLVLVERALGLPRRRTTGVRIWALVAVIATTPLFVDPMLRVVGL